MGRFLQLSVDRVGRIVAKAEQLKLFGDGGIKENPRNYRGVDRRGRPHWRKRPGLDAAERTPSLWPVFRIQRTASPEPDPAPAAAATIADPTETSAALALAPKPDPKTAAKLRAIADGMNAAIEAKLNPGSANQNPTARRARIAAGMMADGERLQRVQIAMCKLADLWENGEVPEVLRGVKTRALVEALVSGRRYRVRSNDPTETRSRWPRPLVAPFQLRDVAAAAKARPRLLSSEQRDLLRRLEMDALAAQSTNGNESVYLTAAQIAPFADAVRKLGRATDDRGRPLVNAAYVLDDVNQAARAWGAGLDSEAKWDHAANLIHDLAPSVELTSREKRLAELKRGLIGTRIPGYFPTPSVTGAQLLDLADIQPGMTVLEPSAGKGNLADLIRERHPDAHLTVVEFNYTLREILALNGHKIADEIDFLNHRGQYDRIVMNPPFENGQDAQHVRHAFSLLKPGGRLVSIMGEHAFFANDRTSRDFREWLEALGGVEERLPDGSFKSSERPTGVRTRVVVVDKPAAIELSLHGDATPDELALVEPFVYQHSSRRGWWIDRHPSTGEPIQVAGAAGPFLTKRDAMLQAVNFRRHAQWESAGYPHTRYDGLPARSLYKAAEPDPTALREHANVVKALVYLEEDDLPFAGPEFRPALEAKRRQLVARRAELEQQIGVAA